MHRPQEQVRQFHKEVVNMPTSPAEPKLRHPSLRAALIAEEAIETVIALVGVGEGQTIVHEQLLATLQKAAREKRNQPDLAEVIDGCMDVLVVTYGTLEDIGVDAQRFFDEVHRANMSKKGGPIREDGKQLKPPNWTPPNIKGLLEMAYVEWRIGANDVFGPYGEEIRSWSIDKLLDEHRSLTEKIEANDGRLTSGSSDDLDHALDCRQDVVEEIKRRAAESQP
jgi:predicted HAD superfamily Cof-like phosphohydrolase